MMSNIDEQICQLPNTSGVYGFFDAVGKLLYVGKATNLKRRVSSYFQKQPREPRLADLIARIARIEYTKTDSVIEALILEANEINTRQPPFNVRLKDDKTFVIIGVTKEEFPRVIVTRPTQKLKTSLKYQFGPYTSADQARTALRIIRKILPFRTTCQVTHLVKQTRSVSVASAPSLAHRTLHLRSVGYGVQGHGVRGCLDYQLGLCPGLCAGIISAADYGRLIRRLILFLQGKKQRLIRELTRDMKSAAQAQDFELAKMLRNQVFALQHIQDVSLLKKESRIANCESEKTHRVEAFDISNIGPDSAVGSMVVITNGQPDKSEYRKFQIKTVAGQNDVRMIEEVLTRRFRHLEWSLPDLVVVDGGKGHLRMAQRTIKKFRLDIPVIAAAKGPERRRFDLYFSRPELKAYGLRITALIRLARDEAHRFAISYHRTRRDHNFLVI